MPNFQFPERQFDIQSIDQTLIATRIFHRAGFRGVIVKDASRTPIAPEPVDKAVTHDTEQLRSVGRFIDGNPDGGKRLYCAVLSKVLRAIRIACQAEGVAIQPLHIGFYPLMFISHPGTLF